MLAYVPNRRELHCLSTMVYHGVDAAVMRWVDLTFAVFCLGGADARAVRGGECGGSRGVPRLLRGVLGAGAGAAFLALQAARGS